MRLMLVLVTILFATVAASFWLTHTLDTTAEELSHNIERVSKEVKSGNWPEADKHIGELEKDWQKSGSWWPMVLDHQEIDNIEFSLAKVKEYIAGKDKVLSQSGLSELNLMIMHLPEKEKPSLKNIL